MSTTSLPGTGVALDSDVLSTGEGCCTLRMVSASLITGVGRNRASEVGGSVSFTIRLCFVLLMLAGVVDMFAPMVLIAIVDGGGDVVVLLLMTAIARAVGLLRPESWFTPSRHAADLTVLMVVCWMCYPRRR